MVGRLIQNRYEIQKPAGQDSFGTIYKGRDRKLDKFVTIKILKEGSGKDIDFFLDRVQFLYSLNHKNIIRFYDAGAESNFYYVIFEYVDGFSLKDFLSEHQLKDPIIYSVQLSFQVCQALDYAHSNYFFHGELKPENIMIANNGTIKLNNFGLRKLQEEIGLSPSIEEMENHPYQSPEQFRGEDIDFRTDIYSLGVIMYEMITGKAGRRVEAREVDSIRRYNENIPKSLETIILKMLRHDPGQRYQSASDILRELCGVKYKSLKPVIQELFPQMDLSSLLPGREYFDEKIIDKKSDEEGKNVTDRQSIEEVDPSKIKLDFRALDRICRGTGIRYKEAKDALIQARGDSLKAIEIIARQRKGSDIKVEEEIVHEEISHVENNEDVSKIWSKLFNGILFIRKNDEDFFSIPSRFLFLLLVIPFSMIFLNFLIFPFIIIFFLILFAFIYFNMSFEIIEKDVLEFRKNVEMTLKYLGANQSEQVSNSNQLLSLDNQMSLPVDIMPVETKRKKEKVVIEEQKIEETVPASEEKEDGKSSARERAARRRQEREKKVEEEPVPVKGEDTKVIPLKQEEPPARIEEQTGPDEETIKYICSRVEGVTEEEAKKALEEENGDQTRAVMSLKKKKRAERKSVPQEEPQEKAPPPEEKPPPAPPPVVSGGKIFDQEKIDYVCRRTKVTPEEAVKALEENNGDEIEAVMSIKKNKRKQRK